MNTSSGQIYFFFTVLITSSSASLVAQMVKHLPAIWETWVWSLGWEDPLEEGMATHSSTLDWKIPLTEEPGRLQSMGSQRVEHDWGTSLSFNHILLKILQSFQSNRKEFQIHITFTSAIKTLNNVKTSIIWCSMHSLNWGVGTWQFYSFIQKFLFSLCQGATFWLRNVYEIASM